MNVIVPIDAAEIALQALYLVVRSGAGAEYETAHRQIFDSLNKKVKFKDECCFEVKINHE